MIDRLPRSYKELPYKKYIAIMLNIPDSKPDSMDDLDWSRFIHLQTLSILLDRTPEEIEELRGEKVAKMIQTIHFLDQAPAPEKTDIKVKKIEALTYDEFVRYQTLAADQWQNMDAILKMLVVNRSEQEISEFSAHDINQVFFCLNKSLKRYLRRLKYLTLARLAKKILLRTLSRILTTKAKKNLEKDGAG